MIKKLEVLLLCDYRPEGAGTVIDHIEAIRDHAGHHVHMLSMFGHLPDEVELDRFDAVVVHYSLILCNDNYVNPIARERLRNYRGLKAVFIQDEYRWVNRAVDALAFIGAQLLFTCVPESEVEKVYPRAKLPLTHKVTVLTGYVPEGLLSIPPKPYGDRPIDVGYRTRKLGAFYGQLAREKWLISDLFEADAERHGLRCDLSHREEERIYGEAWIEFIRSCKAMLGAESGASVFDFTGDLMPAVEAYERDHPEAGFEEIRDLLFPGLDGVIRLNQISPRCFEAAALRTLMILYEGEYSGVLEAWRHYVPLKKDHSNMEEVVAALRDPVRWQQIVDAAYEEIALNPRWSNAGFGELVGTEIGRAAAALRFRRRRAYTAREFKEALTRHVEVNAQERRRLRLYTRVTSFLAMRLPLTLLNPLRYAARKYRSARIVVNAARHTRHDIEGQSMVDWIMLTIRLLFPLRFDWSVFWDLYQLQSVQEACRHARQTLQDYAYLVYHSAAEKELLLAPRDRDHGAGYKPVDAAELKELLGRRAVAVLRMERPGALADAGGENAAARLPALLDFLYRHPANGLQLLYSTGRDDPWIGDIHAPQSSSHSAGAEAA